MSTPKQIEQQKLRKALGTVIGFHGYLNNLKHVVKDCAPKKELLFTEYFLDKAIGMLHHQLAITEKHIRAQLKNLDKLFPPAEPK
jgi:hypothetical protein